MYSSIAIVIVIVVGYSYSDSDNWENNLELGGVYVGSWIDCDNWDGGVDRTCKDDDEGGCGCIESDWSDLFLNNNLSQTCFVCSLYSL